MHILKIIHISLSSELWESDVGARKGSRIGRKPDARLHKSPDTQLPELKISRNEKCETSELPAGQDEQFYWNKTNWRLPDSVIPTNSLKRRSRDIGIISTPNWGRAG